AFSAVERGASVDPTTLPTPGAAVARVAAATLGPLPLEGNSLKLLHNAEEAFPALIDDIDRATESCFLEFYIWSPGGCADDLGAALIRAAKRGVDCRVLVDAFGSNAFLKSDLAKNLRQGGVHVKAALASGLLRILFVRPDLRMHRKIVVIDQQRGYTGS